MQRLLLACAVALAACGPRSAASSQPRTRVIEGLLFNVAVYDGACNVYFSTDGGSYNLLADMDLCPYGARDAVHMLLADKTVWLTLVTTDGVDFVSAIDAAPPPPP